MATKRTNLETLNAANVHWDTGSAIKRAVVCAKCGSDHFHKMTYNAEFNEITNFYPGEPVWRCGCGHITLRQVRQSAKAKELDALFHELLKEG